MGLGFYKNKCSGESIHKPFPIYHEGYSKLHTLLVGVATSSQVTGSLGIWLLKGQEKSSSFCLGPSLYKSQPFGKAEESTDPLPVLPICIV